MSITREQFRLQTDRLIDVFGEKAFSEQREHLIWEICESLERAQVIGMVDTFIRRSRQAPLPQDFADASREFEKAHRKYALGEIKPRELAQCFDCGDSGFIRVERKDQHEAWAKWPMGSLPCHCERGAELIASDKRMKRPVGFDQRFHRGWLSSYDVLPAHNAQSTFSKPVQDDGGAA